MKRLLASCALACALISTSASAGGTHTPGDEDCIPTPETVCEPPAEGGGTQSTPADPTVSVIWINGVPFIVIL